MHWTNIFNDCKDVRTKLLLKAKKVFYHGKQSFVKSSYVKKKFAWFHLIVHFSLNIMRFPNANIFFESSTTSCLHMHSSF